MDSKRWMNVEELASYTGLSKSHLYKLVEKHLIPHVRVGKVLRFGMAETDDWFKKQTVKAVKREPVFPADGLQ